LSETKKIIPAKTGRLRSRPGGWKLLKIVVPVVLVVAVALALYVGYLDKIIRHKFDGKRWALPAVVYARPLELYPGLSLTAPMLAAELQLAGYRQDKAAKDPGGYDLAGNVIRLSTRDFAFPDGVEQSARITVEFSGSAVKKISRTDNGAELALARIDPARIGSFHPLENEDRVVYKREELPDLLVKTLIAVEDQHFQAHFGVDPLGILRAMFANLRALSN